MRTLVGVEDSITVRERRRLILRHTFSGASLTPSDLGPALVGAGGTAVVSGGVLAQGDSTTLVLLATNLGADIIAQARVNFGNSAGATRALQIQARFASAGNYVRVFLSRSGDSLTIQRADAFANTTLASVGSLGLADSTHYWLRFRLSGSRLEALTSTDGSTFTSRVVVTEPLYATNRDLRLVLQDGAASPTITVDDLLVWTS